MVNELLQLRHSSLSAAKQTAFFKAQLKAEQRRFAAFKAQHTNCYSLISDLRHTAQQATEAHKPCSARIRAVTAACQHKIQASEAKMMEEVNKLKKVVNQYDLEHSNCDRIKKSFNKLSSKVEIIKQKLAEQTAAHAPCAKVISELEDKWQQAVSVHSACPKIVASLKETLATTKTALETEKKATAEFDDMKVKHAQLLEATMGQQKNAAGSQRKAQTIVGKLKEDLVEQTALKDQAYDELRALGNIHKKCAGKIDSLRTMQALSRKREVEVTEELLALKKTRNAHTEQKEEVPPRVLAASFAEQLGRKLQPCLGIRVSKTPHPSGGIVVIRPETHSAAYKFGVRKRDVVKEVNGQPVNSRSDFWRLLHSLTPGQTCTVKWVPGVAADEPSSADIKFFACVLGAYGMNEQDVAAVYYARHTAKHVANMDAMQKHMHAARAVTIISKLFKAWKVRSVHKVPLREKRLAKELAARLELELAAKKAAALAANKESSKKTSKKKGGSKNKGGSKKKKAGPKKK